MTVLPEVTETTPERYQAIKEMGEIVAEERRGNYVYFIQKSEIYSHSTLPDGIIAAEGIDHLSRYKVRR
ncbi:MAG: hypothetical protein EOP84_35305 [Verrucomicrobiaceae bacterium]|nr:MAG: hypothetical protein EOP84_35305 [Verrucomicrobiaceae bacterium]